MAVLITDIVGDLVAKMEFTFIIEDLEIITATKFKLFTCNTYGLHNNKTVVIDGETYRVVEFAINEYIVIEGPAIVPIAMSFIIPAPTYEYGTISKTSAELNQIPNKLGFWPLVYLSERIEQDYNQPNTSPIERTAPLRLFFLDLQMKEGWLTKDLKKEVMGPLNNLVDEFINILRKTPYINRGTLLNGVRTELNTFAVYQFSTGGVKNYFDEKLSGIELRISVPIKKGLCNKFVNKNCR